MKQQLLLFFLLCFPLGVFAQATAYPVPNIEQCGNAVFNLHVQTPIVLGGQGPFPGQFEVFYYTSLTGAETGSSEGYISTISAYNYTLVGTSQVIYIRVQNAIGNASDVTSFFISNNEIPPMVGMPDIVACGAFILPPPVPGTSFNTGPNGTNPPVENPYFYTLYVHNVNGPCSSDYPFTVTMAPPGPYPTHDVSACSSYVLPNINAFYFDNPEGTGNNILVGTAINSSMTLYVVPPASESCLETNSFEIHIGDPEVSQPTTPLYGCITEIPEFATFDFHTKFFEVTTVAGHTFSVHASLLEAQNDQGAIDYEQQINISAPQTVYVRVSNGGDCFSIVTLDLVPEICTQNIVYGEIHYDAANNGCSGVLLTGPMLRSSVPTVPIPFRPTQTSSGIIII